MLRVQNAVFLAFVLIGGTSAACGKTCAGSEPASGNCLYPRDISGAVGHHVVLMDTQSATGTGTLCGSPVGDIVYFTVTPDVTGWVSVSSCHPMTMFDTVIEVTTGGDICESGTFVA